MSSLDPHMIIELEDENKSCPFWFKWFWAYAGDILMLMIYMLKIIAYA
jgi:hypothetical protein